MSQNQLYTLVRGSKAVDSVSDEKLRTILDDNLTSVEQKFVKLWKTIETTRFGDFTNQAFSVSFKVTKPIGVTSLGFYGPYETSYADYRLKFNIYEMVSMTRKEHGRLLTSFDKEIKAYRDKVFYVDFNEPLRCPSKTWIRIEFMMNGPVTSVCRKIFPDYRQPGGVIFDFYNSSKQIPEIKYFLL